MHFLQKLFYKPCTTTLQITSSNGFHLRPVAQFVAKAKSFHADITICFKEKEANAKAVNSLLSLSLENGDSFTLRTRGKDAVEAIKALETLFGQLMQGEKAVETIDKESYRYEGENMEGEIIFRGVSIAALFHYKETEIKKAKHLSFHEALTDTFTELETLYETRKGNENANIYLAQKELLHAIADKVDSLETFEQNIEKESLRLLGSKMEAKITDYKDILQRVKKQMGTETTMLLPKTPAILLARDLLPSQIEQIRESQVEGVILKETTMTSHTAILLRSAGIPSLIVDYGTVKEGSKAILDANSGLLVVTPTHKDLEKAYKRKMEILKQKNMAAQRRFEKALTKTEKPIRVFANVTDAASAKEANGEGAEGIGLLRTEFLFKEKQPSLEEQTHAYREIFDLFDEITVRTLDVGGDKKLPYLKLPEEDNPFLGIRGIRLFKTHPKLMEEQLHAIFLAAQGRALKVMFPMVSSVEEFVETKTFAKNTAKKYALDISQIAFGIMVEVPSVLFLIKRFNEVVDFYSIGTNDLTQYLFAVERTHPTLKVDAHSAVVFDAVSMVIDHAEKPVSICGELAADPQAVKKLVEIGVETLSVSPKRIAATKEEIRNV